MGANHNREDSDLSDAKSKSESQETTHTESDSEDTFGTPLSQPSGNKQNDPPTPSSADENEARLKALKLKYNSKSTTLNPKSLVKLYLHIGDNTTKSKWVVAEKLVSYAFVNRVFVVLRDIASGRDLKKFLSTSASDLSIISYDEKFHSLQHLSMANIGISSLEQFLRRRNLQKLVLSDNRIAEGLEFLIEAGLESLRDLDLSNNMILDIDDLRPLAQLRLVSLDLYECPVTRVKDYRSLVFDLIGSLKYLDKMDAEENERPEPNNEGEDEEDDPGSGEIDSEDHLFRLNNEQRAGNEEVVDVVYCVANIHGGGEYGEEWHKVGSQAKKQNCFDNLISAVEYHAAAGYTQPSKLCIEGENNGGLLIGACINQIRCSTKCLEELFT